MISTKNVSDTGSIIMSPACTPTSKAAQEVTGIQELSLHILSQLQPAELSLVGCVCKSWSAITSCEPLWLACIQKSGFNALLTVWPKDISIKEQMKEYISRCENLCNSINGRYGINLDEIGVADWLKDKKLAPLKAREHWHLTTEFWASHFDVAFGIKQEIWEEENGRTPIEFTYRDGFNYLLLKIEIARYIGIEEIDLLNQDPFCTALSTIDHAGKQPKKALYNYWIYVIANVLKEEGCVKRLWNHCSSIVATMEHCK